MRSDLVAMTWRGEVEGEGFGSREGEKVGGSRAELREGVRMRERAAGVQESAGLREQAREGPRKKSEQMSRRSLQ